MKKINGAVRVACCAALLSLLLAPTAPSEAQSPFTQAYVLTEEEVASLLNRALGGVAVQQVSANPGDWQSGAQYLFEGRGLLIYASVLPSAAQARTWFQQISQTIRSGNERTEDDPGPAEEWALDELHGFRVIYLQGGQRRSSYSIMGRLGRAVAIVEAVGSPEADDAGVTDNDRGLALVRAFDLVVGKMHYYPVDSARQVLGIAPFAKEWGRHGLSLAIDGTGHGEGTWRVYQWCSANPTPPCDDMVGNMIQPGGLGAFIFYRVQGTTAYGAVIGSTDPDSLPLGAVTLTLQPFGMAQLTSDGEPIDLCGPDFLRLAPPAVQSAGPCGA